jgi:hydroxymethylglutaryl-CoA reductase (NADPH)
VEKGVAFCVTLPAVIVGTVGGGTGLPTQKEALAIMGLAGGNEGKHALTLAKVVGAAVLAGELSLTASIAQGSLAQTHASFRKRSRIT